MIEDEKERVSSAYRNNYDRLVALKTKYDPENILRINHNTQPKLGQK